VILLAFATFTYAKGPDMGVLSDGIAHISFPLDKNNYSAYISGFTWERIGGNDLTFHNCFYKLNGTRYELTDCLPSSIPFVNTLVDGKFSLVLFANVTDSADNDYPEYFMANSQFLIDTLPPQISITSPADNSNNGIPVTQIDYVITETNLQSCWFTNGSINDYSIPCINGVPQTFVFENHEGNNTWTICAKDIVGHETCDTVTFWVDSSLPTISFTDNTNEEGANISSNDFFVEVNVTEEFPTNITFVLYDNLMNKINETSYIESNKLENSLFSLTWNQQDGTYFYEVTIFDSVGHQSSVARTITLDTTAPIITLNNPNNSKAFVLSDNIIFDFDVDEINPYTCELSVDTNVYVINPGDFVLASTLGAGQHYWNINCKDFVNNENTSDTRVFTVLSNLTFPDGTDYTNLTNELNISSVYFWIRNGNGSIYWTDPIDMSRGAKWSDYITLEFNKARVDTTATGAYEFKDKKANITLYNITWNSPQILRDGEICSSDICTELLGGYVANVSYMFNVTSFSTYETRETPVVTYGATGSGSVCKTNWTCTAWSTCFGDIQTRTCTKVKLFCIAYTDKPAEKQSCIERKSVNTTQIQQAPEQQAITNNQPQGGTGITGFIIAHPASTAATLIAILGVASYFVVSRIRAKSLKPEPAKTGGKEGVSWITSKSAEKVDSV
jgi:hypothetical protein